MTDKQLASAIKAARRLVRRDGSNIYGAPMSDVDLQSKNYPVGDKASVRYRLNVQEHYYGQATEAVIKALACRMLGFPLDKCIDIATNGYVAAGQTEREISELDGAI